MKNKKIRKGVKDIWNAFMVKGAKFSNKDIPLCPTTAKSLPRKLITFSEAKTIHYKMVKKDKNYLIDAFVCFYEDDYKFDGKRKGIWVNPSFGYNILKHFKGIITPDFSTYIDFPDPLLRWNTYRMRAYGFWYGTLCKKEVINNLRWGFEDSYDYCFDGIEDDTIVAIGTVGGSPRKLEDKKRFENGLFKFAEEHHPKCIIVFGSCNYDCFNKLREKGIKILHYESKTEISFKKVLCNRKKE